ncbi:MAG: glutamate--tRNA ligase [Candidatus Aenigmatarchaeota archaeon]|nr:MAG: glutamate--tRNA ligase [Candidatus Aenigmarchaeota archaeon]
MVALKELALKYVLQNAVFYHGKADPGAVLGKILGANPHLRKKVPEVKKEVEKAVQKVNAMSLEEQHKTLKGMKPSMLKKEVKKHEGLPEIRGALRGRFVTRFAPSPTGPLNLGQFLRAAVVPYLYAKKYNGKFVVRIEDTDLKKIEKKFYDMIEEDLKITGIKWDKLVLESDSMETYYEHAEHLIKSKKAYVCRCPADDFKKAKMARKACKCRPGSDLKAWKDMLKGKYREGEVIVRFKTSMSHSNPAMRDPPMLRVAKGKHPLKGTKYKVWPLYNFACAVEDHQLGITHVFRGKEHEHNTAVQKLFYNAFRWRVPEFLNFGMVYLPGTKIHTRDMKEWIEEGRASGWDDPRLPTVRALLRRGFRPEALLKFAQDVGITKNDIRVGWENIEGINRKMIDPEADRYMVVTEPHLISLDGAPETCEVSESVHPDFPKRGKRKMPLDLQEVYLSGEDFRHLLGKTVRLKGLGNIKLGKKSKYLGNEIVTDMPKIQWVSKPHVRVSLKSPDGPKKAIGEINLKNLKTGALIQMERIGFGRVDSVKGNDVTVYFAHR